MRERRDELVADVGQPNAREQISGGAARRAGRARPKQAEAPARDTAPRPLEAWWALLERDRATLFERVLRADPTARLEHTVEHPFFGPLNWRETLLFIRLHDLDHAGQLQKVAGALATARSA